MKIYLADTIQREELNYNSKFKIQNNLESYFALIKNNKDIKNWTIFKGRKDETENEKSS